MKRYNLDDLSKLFDKKVKEIRLSYVNGEALEVLFRGESWPSQERIYATHIYHCSDCDGDFSEPGELINNSCRMCGSENVTKMEGTGDTEQKDNKDTGEES